VHIILTHQHCRRKETTRIWKQLVCCVLRFTNASCLTAILIFSRNSSHLTHSYNPCRTIYTTNSRRPLNHHQLCAYHYTYRLYCRITICRRYFCWTRCWCCPLREYPRVRSVTKLDISPIPILKRDRHVYTTNQPMSGGTRMWVPCVDKISERCMWDMIFIVPQKMTFSEDDVYDDSTNDVFQEGENTVVCSGEIMEQVRVWRCFYLAWSRQGQPRSLTTSFFSDDPSHRPIKENRSLFTHRSNCCSIHWIRYRTLWND
jgi:hypothetical protein